MSDKATKNGDHNAFTALMSRRRRRYSKSGGGSEFVACPAGCGQHIRTTEVNAHLDRCCIVLSVSGDGAASLSSPLPSSSLPPLSMSTQSSPKEKLFQFDHKAKKRRATCPVCDISFPTSLINLHLDQCVERPKTAAESKVHTSDARTVLAEDQSTLAPLVEGMKDGQARLPMDETTTHSVNTFAVVNKETIPRDESLEEESLPTELSITCTGQSSDGKLSPDSPKRSPSLEQETDFATCVDECHDERVAAAMTNAVSPSPHQNRAVSAFAKMMHQAKASCQQEKAKATQTIPQSFHLDENLRLTWHGMRNSEQEWSHPTWSSMVTLKEHDPPSSPVMFEVHVSTSISYCENEKPIRWVRRHSRLSVPVLKSILQKSIRRRRPLPSVRVAMELADKSLGDLLRRLPIIMLEDSTMHSEVDLVVWLMMAQAKDFVPPRRLLTRLFQIVYEMASCPWIDPIQLDESVESPDKSPMSRLTLTSLSEQSQTDSLCASSSSGSDGHRAIMWSLLVRAKYGGMKCDVDMLSRAARVWYQRWATPLPATVAARLGSSATIANGDDEQCKIASLWAEVPFLIHQRAREVSVDKVSNMCAGGIECLGLDDVCVQGVDFHCSPIVDALLSDQQLCGICMDLLVLGQVQNGKEPIRLEDRSTVLGGMFKQDIWNFSSSINYRRHLHSGEALSSSEKDGRAGLWNELVAPRALSYQTQYIMQRLA
jgi:hypothetical protein